jgi:glycerate 2-kinase
MDRRSGQRALRKPAGWTRTRPVKILIIPDKFKGTLSAREAADAIASGWRRHRPQDDLDLLPMSDGGDGFGEVIGALLPARVEEVATVDAAHRPRQAQWWWADASRTAIIEAAQVVGIAHLPRRRYHPFALDTFGLGAVLMAAAERGAEKCLIGVGGSATNDGSFGLARALGWRFLDLGGRALERWTDLASLDRLQPPVRPLRFRETVVAVDVQNPLLGPAGCTRVYGPQKGLRAAEYSAAEACLRRLASVVKRQLGHDLARARGAGAAGGLGFGLRTFVGARLEPGFAVFARCANLDERLESAALVITAEGAIDHSTLMGKGVGEVARRCGALRRPCLGLGGRVDLDPRRHAHLARLARELFTVTHAIVPRLTTLATAQRRAGHWLAELAAQVAAAWVEK